MKQKIIAASMILLFILLLPGCNLPGFGLQVNLVTGTPDPDDMINTAAAKTVAALGTEIANGRNPTLIGPVTPTLTPTITLTPAPNQPSPTLTQAPSGDCNRAQFVRDVTIPDGSTILSNSVFVKTWELKNTGTCTWNSSYQIVFAGKGSSMSGPAGAQLFQNREVKPGETAQISVTLRAPNDPGEYDGYWMMRASDGKQFGTGQNGGAPFYVKIRVANHEYFFAEHLCSAQWSSGAGDLPCPGTEGDSKGYAVQVQNPAMEDNQQHEGPGMLTAAQAVGGGYIVGKFPPVIVPSESDFRSVLSCHPSASGCFVRFRVTYRVDNGEEQVLGEWNEGFEGGVTNAVKDLDMVAGRSTAFYFYIYVTGTPDQSRAIWFNPRITK